MYDYIHLSPFFSHYTAAGKTIQNYGVLKISKMTVKFGVISEHCHGSIVRGRLWKVVHVDEEKEWFTD